MTLYTCVDTFPEIQIMTINAVTEIIASYPQFNRQKIELTRSNESIGILNPYKGWVFVRCEN